MSHFENALMWFLRYHSRHVYALTKPERNAWLSHYNPSYTNFSVDIMNMHGSTKNNGQNNENMVIEAYHISGIHGKLRNLIKLGDRSLYVLARAANLAVFCRWNFSWE